MSFHESNFVSSTVRLLAALPLVVTAAFTATQQPQRPSRDGIGTPPESLVKEWKLSAFYRKHLDAAGFPILSSEKVSDFALLEARYLVDRMLDGRDDIRAALVKNRVRFVVLAYNEMTTTIPEYSDLTPAKYWDRRARGLGATHVRPAVSGSEENLLCYPGDPYAGENITVHEFAHAIHEMGLRSLGPEFDRKLKSAFDHAKEKGLWKGTYAATDTQEYWAEGVQSWFDCNQKAGGVHNDVDTREELLAYDPELADLIASVFPNKSWRYERPDRRKDAAHLKGYDPSKAPRFAWPADLPPLPRDPSR
jgi:hypothetical protein